MVEYKDLLVSNEEKNKIKQNSPDTLPLNPTAQGFSGQEVRRRLAKSIVGENDSVLSLIQNKMEKLVELLSVIAPGVEISNVIGKEVELYVNTLPLENLRTIDGVETKPFDLVLVGELGEFSGLYLVQEGEWVKVSDVYPNQVFSIYNGNLYGGSMLKLLENNNITKARSKNDVIVSDLEPEKPRINMMWYQLLED